MRESTTIEAGNEILPPFDTVVGKIGSMICFDLRFPEISLAHKRQKADVLLYPSAFTVETGKAHWLSLLRARAIECEAFVIAAAQVGAHNAKRISYGHSIVISPWGEVMAELDGEKKEEPEVILVDIDLKKASEMRQRLPLLRRTLVDPRAHSQVQQLTKVAEMSIPKYSYARRKPESTLRPASCLSVSFQTLQHFPFLVQSQHLQF